MVEPCKYLYAQKFDRTRVNGALNAPGGSGTRKVFFSTLEQPPDSFNKHLIFLFFGIAILSLKRILEGSRHLSLRLSVILLHQPLHTKIQYLDLTPFISFAKHLVPSK